MMDFLWKNFFNQEEKTTISILSKNPVFKSLSAREQILLSEVVHKRSFIPGEIVFQTGKGLGMYIILSGKISILYNPPDGSEHITVSQLKEGEFFGELALVKEKSYNNISAQSVEKSKLLGFFRPDLFSLTEKNPVMATKILMNLGEILGERLQKASDKLSQFNQKMES